MPTEFKLQAPYEPAGDQPAAIKQLVEGIGDGLIDQVLLGVTGSGKTFTMANVIQKTQRPALILCHNKTLAAQIYGEMKQFFPENAVEYFVSYYDYYQPEAYIPKTDTFIEKDSAINEQIDRMRHSATRAILERKDCIIVASVSCIYGIGSPDIYGRMVVNISKSQTISQKALLRHFTDLQYERNDVSFERGTFRVKGDTVDIFPSHYEDKAWRISMFGDEIETITEFDPLTGYKTATLNDVNIFPNSHYVTPQPTMDAAVKHIKAEMVERVKRLEEENKLVEAQRIRQRTEFDIEMIITTGMCKGIENYSRYLSNRKAGEPPPTLFEYIPKDALLFIDESHVSVSQIGGMYNGDRARKTTLVEHGFRLPSALDNRPLQFSEFEKLRPQTIYVSATPGKFEMEKTGGKFVEQLIRPTGLVDPVCDVRPAEFQVDDLIAECRKVVANGNRVLVTTLTKKMSESLTEYMEEQNIRVRYLHSDVETLDRIEIIRGLRLGEFDVLIGINLLREGLDIPECGLVAILDADKEGFLRSTTSLIQTIGRAARNVDGRVILYADKMTKSLNQALEETERRRNKQIEHNKIHGITPQTIRKKIAETMTDYVAPPEKEEIEFVGGNVQKHMEHLRKEMLKAAGNLEFEKAASIRDEIHKLEDKELGLD